MSRIFEPKQVSDSDIAPIHALCLQLVAKGIVKLDINDEGRTHVGTKNLRHNMVTVILGTNANGFTCYDDACWNGLTWVPEASEPTQQAVATTPDA